MTVIPAAAFMLWAIAIVLGADPEVLRFVGPAVVGSSVAASYHWEFRRGRD